MINLDLYFIYIKYYYDGWSGYDLAKHFNCSKNTIYRNMEKNGMIRRDGSEANKELWKCENKRKIMLKGMQKRIEKTKKRIEKKCPQCNNIKSLNDFPICNVRTDKKAGYCISCKKIYDQKYYKNKKMR